MAVQGGPRSKLGHRILQYHTPTLGVYQTPTIPLTPSIISTVHLLSSNAMLPVIMSGHDSSAICGATQGAKIGHRILQFPTLPPGHNSRATIVTYTHLKAFPEARPKGGIWFGVLACLLQVPNTHHPRHTHPITCHPYSALSVAPTFRQDAFECLSPHLAVWGPCQS